MYVILLYIIMKGCVHMPALQKRSDLINLEQYENLPEDFQIEVFDGIIYNMASPSEDHQNHIHGIININKQLYPQ